LRNATVAESAGGRTKLSSAARRFRPLDDAVAAFHRAVGFEVILGVIGEGPEGECLAQLSRRLGVENAVIFLGTVDHQALKGAFEACQALVFSTLQDFTGRVVVESLSAGARVVASPMTGAVGTIVHDGVNGIVVDPRDASAHAAVRRPAVQGGQAGREACATPLARPACIA
jgi:glycosyltransferase involved in cell wall biosynthesis